MVMNRVMGTTAHLGWSADSWFRFSIHSNVCRSQMKHVTSVRCEGILFAELSHCWTRQHSCRMHRKCEDQLAAVFTCLKGPSIALSQCRRSLQHHPGTLTPTVINCSERLGRRYIKTKLPPSLDLMQFAYCPNYSTDYVIATTINLALTQN